MNRQTLRRTIAAFAVAGTIPFCAAHAQTGTAAPLSAIDKTFLTKNAEGSIYDYTTAEAAANLAQSDAVRDYATRLLDDHTRLNKDILTLARSRKLALPLTLKASDARKLESLTRKKGAAFDRAYLEEAVKINADDVRQAKKETGVTTDPDVKAFVFNFQQTEEKHLADARALLQKMK